MPYENEAYYHSEEDEDFGLEGEGWGDIIEGAIGGHRWHAAGLGGLSEEEDENTADNEFLGGGQATQERAGAADRFNDALDEGVRAAGADFGDGGTASGSVKQDIDVARVGGDLGRAFDATTATAGANVGDAAQLQHVRMHRHDMPAKLEQHSPVATVIWAVVILHLLALAVWLRVWWRQRRAKDPTMRAPTPPQKQSATYDMDKSFAIPRIELPLKALKLAKA